MGPIIVHCRSSIRLSCDLPTDHKYESLSSPMLYAPRKPHRRHEAIRLRPSGTNQSNAPSLSLSSLCCWKSGIPAPSQQRPELLNGHACGMEYLAILRVEDQHVAVVRHPDLLARQYPRLRQN